MIHWIFHFILEDVKISQNKPGCNSCVCIIISCMPPLILDTSHWWQTFELYKWILYPCVNSVEKKTFRSPNFLKYNTALRHTHTCTEREREREREKGELKNRGEKMISMTHDHRLKLQTFIYDVNDEMQ